MKTGQFRSENDRVASIVLLVCMAIIVAGCVMGVFYLQEYNFYGGDGGRKAKSVAVQIYSDEDIGLAKDYYLCHEAVGNHSEEIREYKIDYYEKRFSPENTNFVFAVYGVGNEILFDSLTLADDETMKGLTFEEAVDGSAFKGQSDFFFFDEESVSQNLRLRYGIMEIDSENSDRPVAKDRYSNAFQWIDIAYSLRYFVFLVLFVTVVIIVYLLKMIAANAGTLDKETGEIVPGFIDRVPLYIIRIIMVLLFIAAKVVYELSTAADVGMVLNNVVVMIISVAAVLVVMMYMSTVSVRRKIKLSEENRKTPSDEDCEEKSDESP